MEVTFDALLLMLKSGCFLWYGGQTTNCYAFELHQKFTKEQIPSYEILLVASGSCLVEMMPLFSKSHFCPPLCSLSLALPARF